MAIMKNLPTLRGEKVYLGSFPETEEFYEEYRSWLNSARVRAGTGEEEATLEEVRAMLKEWQDDAKNYTFCVYDVESNEPIGDVSLRYGWEKYDNNGPETAIMIGKRAGQGKGLEAMKLILDYGFNVLKVKVVNLSVYVDNLPAIKMYQKLGFETVKEEVDASNGRKEFVMKLEREKN